MADVPLNRERDPHPVLLVFAAAALLAGAAGLFVLVSSQDTSNAVINQPTSFDAPRLEPEPAAPIVVTSLERLGEDEPEALQGRAVALVNVAVRDVVGDYTFWVGDAAGRVPVVLLGEATARQPENRTEVHTGDRVNIFGSVRLMRNPARLDEAWAIDDSERRQLGNAPLYISAEQVVVTSRQAD